MIIRQISCTAIAIVLLLITACQKGFDRGQPGEETGSPREERTDVDPLNLEEDFEIVPGHVSVAMSQSGDNVDQTDSATIIPDVPNTSDNDPGRIESYRIQLFTSKTYQPANAELNIAREVFDQPVWLDYEVPYYKVRVGDFATSDEAEKYVSAAKEAGYKTAWVVKVNLAIRQMEDIYDNAPIESLIDTTGQAPGNETEPPDEFDENQENQPENPRR